MSGVQRTKRGRGREPGFRMSNEHRLKIQKSNVLNVLMQHAEGKREMTATQVQAGLGLLKKVLPDLNSVTISGDEENPIELVTKVELIAPSGKRST